MKRAGAIAGMGMTDDDSEMPYREPAPAEGPAPGESWDDVARRFRAGEMPLSQPWEEIFGPLRTGAVDDLVVVGQCGQSIDARIATPTGHSHYINSEGGLLHLHRLRSLVDAVVIGVGTAIADDPQLTVRRVRGRDPARVVIDPNARLPLHSRLLNVDGTRTLVVTSSASPRQLPTHVEPIALQTQNGRLDPAAISAALRERGFRRLLVEGGAETVSRFLAARCLDRLHILVAPLILGSGRPSLTLPPILRVEHAPRVSMRAHVLAAHSAQAAHTNIGCSIGTGADLLLDCDLTAHRKAIGRAKKST
jgi:diaminohydroxyphosphoribosylaminopyrimidine deaminase/5-amino-6-(5-phosphoribosylamino)uracil reductase